MLSKRYLNTTRMLPNATQTRSERDPNAFQAHHPKRKPNVTQPHNRCSNAPWMRPNCNPSGNQAQPRVRGVYDFKAIAAASAGKISSPFSNSKRQCRFSVRFQVRRKAPCALSFIFPDVYSWPCQTGIAQNAFAARREKVQSTGSDPNSGAGKSIS